MKEMMAKEIGVEDGDMIVSSKGIHLYDYQYNDAKKAVGLSVYLLVETIPLEKCVLGLDTWHGVCFS